MHSAGESSFEVNIKANSNYITEHQHNDKSRPYLCTMCDKKFTTKKTLKRHKQLHNALKLYSCTQCEKRFLTEYYLRSHMNVFHSSKYKCTECGKCFSSNQPLTRHRQIHSGEKLFECTVCSKRFTRYTRQNSQWRETIQMSRV